MDSPSPQPNYLPEISRPLAHSETTASSDPSSFCLTEFGHFRRLEFLGAGGMGKVYKAYDSVHHRNVALKFVSTDSMELKQRFLMEARAQGITVCWNCRRRAALVLRDSFS